MRKVKLALSDLNSLHAIAKARVLVSMQTGNPAYGTPVPSLASITAAAERISCHKRFCEDRIS